MPGRRTISIMASPAIAPPPKKKEYGPSRAASSLQSKARSLPFDNPISPWKLGPKGKSKGDIRAGWGLGGGPLHHDPPDAPKPGDIKVSPVLNLMKTSEKYGKILDIRPTGVTACDVDRKRNNFEGLWKFKAAAKAFSPGVAACDGGKFSASSGGDKRKKRK